MERNSVVRFDERFSVAQTGLVPSDALIRRFQRAYPQIWYHCHTTHTGRDAELTQRESSVLSHLSHDAAMSPGELAEHLGIGASTLSEAVDKLVQRGLVQRCIQADRRRVRYQLTTAGDEMLDQTSALSSESLRRVLGRLSATDREHAVAGLELIANACTEGR